MEQYYHLFSSCRIPGRLKDQLVVCSRQAQHPDDVFDDAFDQQQQQHQPQHDYIIVACNNQFFQLPVTTSGQMPNEEEFFNILKNIVKRSRGEEREEMEETDEAEQEESERDEHDTRREIESDVTATSPPTAEMGILTTLPRNEWAEIREHLLSDPTNKKHLQSIENCIFILCLDKQISHAENGAASTSSSTHTHKTGGKKAVNEEEDGEEGMRQHQRDDVSNALQLLHGCGMRCNGANRWYDKTMQFVVSIDGNCGLNYEHSVAEGIAVIRLIEHILQYMEEVKSKRYMKRWCSINNLPKTKKLIWHMDDTIRSAIERATKSLDKLIDELDIYILRFNKYGRNFPKTMNMSPDSYIQLALQLAYYKAHKCLVATYESASIRRFHLGRVDVIRAASIPAQKWCEAMTGSITCSANDKIRLLRCAMEWQTRIMMDAILGHGVDNHLLGLRETARESGNSTGLPELFTDKSYIESNKFNLSTSQVPTTKDAFLAYGAVVEDGYGAAYNPHSDNIVIAISCWRTSNSNKRADVFAKSLESAFVEMHDLLNSNPELARLRPQTKLAPSDRVIPEEPSQLQTCSQPKSEGNDKPETPQQSSSSSVQSASFSSSCDPPRNFVVSPTSSTQAINTPQNSKNSSTLTNLHSNQQQHCEVAALRNGQHNPNTESVSSPNNNSPQSRQFYTSALKTELNNILNSTSNGANGGVQ